MVKTGYSPHAFSDPAHRHSCLWQPLLFWSWAVCVCVCSWRVADSPVLVSCVMHSRDIVFQLSLQPESCSPVLTSAAAPQVLPDAVAALTNPCLGLSGEYPWAFVFAGAAAMFTLTLEMTLRGWIFQ